MTRPHQRPTAYRRWADAGARDWFWQGQLFLYAHIAAGTVLGWAIRQMIASDAGWHVALTAAILIYVAGPVALLVARRNPL